jgi:hypothetical protein
MGALNRKQSSFRRDAEANTRNARTQAGKLCAPQKSRSIFLIFQITQRQIGSAWKLSRFSTEDNEGSKDSGSVLIVDKASFPSFPSVDYT